MTTYRTAMVSAEERAAIRAHDRIVTLIDRVWKLQTTPSRPADYDADLSSIVSDYGRGEMLTAIMELLGRLQTNEKPENLPAPELGPCVCILSGQCRCTCGWLT